MDYGLDSLADGCACSYRESPGKKITDLAEENIILSENYTLNTKCCDIKG